MKLIISVLRFFTAWTGLWGGRVDQATDRMMTTPDGIRATYAEARNQWRTQFRDVRDAVAELMAVVKQKEARKDEIDKRQEELERMKAGAVQRFSETKDAKYQTAFNDYTQQLARLQAEEDQLVPEIATLNNQVSAYRLKLQDMQRRVAELDIKESQAIADVVSSNQIVALNDKLGKVSTNLNDQRLSAIDKAVERQKAAAQLSDSLSSNDAGSIDQELLSAGMTSDAQAEFNAMLAKVESKHTVTVDIPATERHL